MEFLRTHKKLILIAAVTILVFLVLGVTLINNERNKVVPKISTTKLQGQVGLPEGFPVNPQDLRVATVLDEQPVGSNARFAVEGLETGEQLAMVINSDGTPLFLGLVDSKNTDATIDSRSTGVILLFYHIGAIYLPYTAWPAVLDMLASFTENDSLSQQIAAIASRDPLYLTNGNKELEAELAAATGRLKKKAQSVSLFDLFRAKRAFASTLPALDTGEKSGVRIDAGSFNDVIVTNTRRRIVRANIYEIGYKKDNTDIVRDIPKKVATVDTPTVGKLTDLASTVYDLVVGKIHYAESEQTRIPVTLSSEEPSADATLYRVIGLGWGRWREAEGASIVLTPGDAQDLKEITVITAFQEIVFPLFMMGLSSEQAEQLFGGPGSAGTAMVTETARWMLTDPRADNEGGKAVLEKLTQGDLKEATKNMIEFLAKSETLRGKIAEGIVSLIQGTLGEKAAEKFVTKIAGIFAQPIKAVDIALKAFDATALFAAFDQSNQIEQWIIATRPPRITLTPESATVKKGDRQVFTVEVQKGEQNLNLAYEWYHKNEKMGEFEGRTGEVFASTQNTAAYIVKDDEEGDDTIELKVYWLRDQGPKTERIFLGSKNASLTNKPAGVSIAPAEANLAFGETKTFTVSLKKGAKNSNLEYFWFNSGQAGEFIEAPDPDKFTSKDALTVNYKMKQGYNGNGSILVRVQEPMPGGKNWKNIGYATAYISPKATCGSGNITLPPHSRFFFAKFERSAAESKYFREKSGGIKQREVFSAPSGSFTINLRPHRAGLEIGTSNFPKNNISQYHYFSFLVTDENYIAGLNFDDWQRWGGHIEDWGRLEFINGHIHNKSDKTETIQYDCVLTP